MPSSPGFELAPGKEPAPTSNSETPGASIELVFDSSILLWVTGKISTFGTLAQRGLAGNDKPDQPKRRTRHVFVALRVNDQILERPGVLLDWVQQPLGNWVAQVAYVADDQGTLVVAWCDSEQLTPVPHRG